MGKDIIKQIDLLYSRDHSKAYQALKVLEAMSKENNAIYLYMNRFIEMINHTNSYVRNRGLLLIAYNVKGYRLQN